MTEERGGKSKKRRSSTRWGAPFRRSFRSARGSQRRSRDSSSSGPRRLSARVNPKTARAYVSKEMRVFTREGCPRLRDLVDREVEVWSGRRWARVRVGKTSTPATFYRVRLDDGTSLTCTADHSWAVVDGGRVVPVHTRDLRTDLAVSPFVVPNDPSGLSAERSSEPGAYSLGAKVGSAISRKPRLSSSLPPQVFAMSAPSLGNFVAGWMDSQRGALFGGHGAILGLQLALRRQGVYNTFVSGVGRKFTLALSEKDASAIPNPKNNARDYRRTLSTLPRVVEVYELSGREKPFTISSDDAKTIVIGGVLTLC